jgi:hypothetical protein
MYRKYGMARGQECTDRGRFLSLYPARAPTMTADQQRALAPFQLASKTHMHHIGASIELHLPAATSADSNRQVIQQKNSACTILVRFCNIGSFFA